MTVLDPDLLDMILKESKNPNNRVMVGGNSTVAQVTVGAKSYAVKNYSSRSDALLRQQREWNALVFLDEVVPDLAPKPFWRANEEPIAIHSWIHGSKPKLVPETVDAMIGILASLQDLYKTSAPRHQFARAVDSINNSEDLSQQILRRIEAQNRVYDRDIARLSNYIEQQLTHLNMQPHIQARGSKSHTTLSPSDFGPHNMIYQPRASKYRLIDLEFFGVDDVHKLVGDTILHPQTVWTADLLNQFLDGAKNVLSIDLIRLRELLPFLSLKWSAIVVGRISRLDGTAMSPGLKGQLEALAMFYSNLGRPGDLDSILSRIVAKAGSSKAPSQSNEKD